MCYENGGIVDDFLIYMMDKDYYLLVVNAANTDKDYEWLVAQNKNNEHVIVENVSNTYALLALQGPLAENILQKVTDENIAEIKPFSFKNNVKINQTNFSALISRTGYTGEDGFEIYVHSEHSRELWSLLLKVGEEEGLEPAGLGARDTLRFEAGLPLYGQELSEDITTIEAGLTCAVKINKDSNFIGKSVLKEQIEHGVRRKIVGIEMIDKGIPRTGYEVLSEDGNKIGFVTSGTQSPTLQKNIGLAMVEMDYSELGTEIYIQVRKRKLKAIVIPTPFYSRKK